jgi:hypothetical protein
MASTSNIAGMLEPRLGDVAAGFAAADVIVECCVKTAPVHQGYVARPSFCCSLD